MNKKHRCSHVLCAAIAMAVLTASVAIGDDEKPAGANASGGWTWEYEGFRGRTMVDTVKLAVDGSALTGEHDGAFGAIKIENGKIDGKKVSFSVSRSFGDRTITSAYTGNVDGDTISGSIESEGFNDTNTLDWKAYRLPEFDPSGLWLWKTTSRRDNSERKSWVKLDYDKGKLTGLYLTERNQIEIQNATLKGTAIRFEIARRGRGGRGGDQPAPTVYSGTLSEKGIAGSIKMRFQDQERDIDWTASRDTPKVDPVGTWAWKQRGRDDEEVENSIVIKKGEDGALSGTYNSSRGEVVIDSTKLEGDTLTFTATREGNQGSFTSKYTAKIDGDDIAGSVGFDRGERTWKFPFAAKRKLAKAEPVGTWGWTTRRFSRNGDGGEVKNTVALKSEEGKLTGTFTSGDNSSSVKNAKLDGNTLSFDVERAFRERSFTVHYTGTVRGDVITGTSRNVASEGSANAASQWANRWEAKRD